MLLVCLRLIVAQQYEQSTVRLVIWLLRIQTCRRSGCSGTEGPGA